jgi:2-isopropylmalate synthase
MALGDEHNATAHVPGERDLVYDWNVRKRRHPLAHGPIQLYDETLRDGIQGPSIIDPPLEEKARLVELADAIGIHSINVGLPGAGPRAAEHSLELTRHIAERRLSIRPSCAARTAWADIRPIVELSQQVGLAVEVMAFLGASPIRQYVEGWDLAHLVELTTSAIGAAAREGLPVTFVVEDTSRSQPATLGALFRAAIESGARRLCLCDTVGHATPDGVHNLIDFTRDVIESTGVAVGIDWHGHNDRGLALTNTLSAIEYGADRVHGTALGIGERVGNAPLDLVLVNLRLLGEIDNDLSRLPEWCRLASRATGIAIPHGYPLLGSDAFRTATGVHAAAILKATRKGERWLADRVYSGVPASLVGCEQLIEVGPMSGLSNVTHWLATHGYDATPEQARRVLDAAKASDRVLTDRELVVLAERHGAVRRSSSSA